LKNLTNKTILEKKHLKVCNLWFVYFCKWWHHTRKTNNQTACWVSTV